MGSLIQEYSEECGTSPLELSQIQPTQTAVEKSYRTIHKHSYVMAQA